VARDDAGSPKVELADVVSDPVKMTVNGQDNLRCILCKIGYTLQAL
jgi:hypothetical protein